MVDGSRLDAAEPVLVNRRLRRLPVEGCVSSQWTTVTRTLTGWPIKDLQFAVCAIASVVTLRSRRKNDTVRMSSRLKYGSGVVDNELVRSLALTKHTRGQLFEAQGAVRQTLACLGELCRLNPGCWLISLYMREATSAFAM